MLSIWERELIKDVDVAIVGAGLVGLFTAYWLKLANRKLKVAVFESSAIPSGASTRNGGFVSCGGLLELSNDTKEFGLNSAAQNYLDRWTGIELLTSFFNPKLDLSAEGGFDLLTSQEEEQVLHELDRWNALFEAERIGPRFTQGFDQLGRRAVGLKDRTLNSGKLYLALTKELQKLKVQLYYGASVVDVNDGVLTVGRGSRPTYTVHAKNVVLATNAGLASANLGVRPARNVVLVVKPSKPLDLSSYHLHAGYVYVRPVGQEILIGGGRHLDPLGEQTVDWVINPLIKTYLLQTLKDLLRPLTNGDEVTYTVTHEWCGTLAFSQDNRPIIKRLPNKALAVFACNGMGVAMSPLIAKQAARELLV